MAKQYLTAAELQTINDLESIVANASSDLGIAKQAATEYETELRNLFRAAPGKIVRFQLPVDAEMGWGKNLFVRFFINSHDNLS